jgi:hypothetical protein
MCITKKLTEIFVSNTYEARDKEWALTEAALFQTSIMNGRPLRIFVDRAADITLARQIRKMIPTARIEELFVT